MLRTKDGGRAWDLQWTCATEMASADLTAVVVSEHTQYGMAVGVDGTTSCVTEDAGLTWRMEPIEGNTDGTPLMGVDVWDAQR
eukprot:6744460-Pyramimonas_sp.AAC.1